jgi:hypothetical protein
MKHYVVNAACKLAFWYMWPIFWATNWVVCRMEMPPEMDPDHPLRPKNFNPNDWNINA